MTLSKIRATQNDHGRKLIKVLMKYFPSVPTSRLERLFRKKDIKINNQRNFSKDYVVQQGDEILVYGLEQSEILDQEITKSKKRDFKVVYEDQNILIVDKKAGVVMHSNEDSLDSQIMDYLKFIPNDSFTISHIGRLDKETSGLVIYAKNYQILQELTNKNAIVKTYVYKADRLGRDLRVEGFLTKDDIKQKMIFSTNKKSDKSQRCSTYFFESNTKQFAQIKTGRKHQIRATLFYLGTPIYGDLKYGGKKADRLMLHAYTLKLQKLSDQFAYLNNQEFISEVKW
ncbi:pseudouridine synthase family protein [Mycoplasmopsis pullorum]|uniref:pseudouridine synthase family protein n=1 Tax=Mycoplasmopsis pullorum TaxID=48003 RepID=UPI001F2C61DA|nr:RluA family pseudouridine synthase [Mycoplasmopsis pullorum]